MRSRSSGGALAPVDPVLRVQAGETDGFKGKHINFDAGVIYIDGTKSKNAKRIVPVPEDLLADYKKLNLRPEEYVF